MPAFSFPTLTAVVTVTVLSTLSVNPARADSPPRPVTLWAGPNAALGDTKHDLDYAFGIDVDVLRRPNATLVASLGYHHALTADAGNVHRFPLMGLVRIGKPTSYFGGGIGVSFSDENSARIGVSRRTETAFTVLAGAEVKPIGRIEARFIGASRPSKDGVILLCVGVRL